MRGGDYSLRLPLVVGPRYVPPRSRSTARRGASPTRSAVTTAPLAHPRRTGPLNPVSIEIHLQPGFPIANLDSPYHRIDARGGAGAAAASSASPTARCPPTATSSCAGARPPPTPRSACSASGSAAHDYLMAMLTPPVDDRRAPMPPREMIFVIDNSGSMAGESMEQAQGQPAHALRHAEAGRPVQRHPLRRHDDRAVRGAGRRPAADQVALALRFAEGLEAEGGTEMLPALRAALVDPTPATGASASSSS